MQNNELLDVVVLYVEDDDFAREVTTEILKRTVREFHTCTNGYEGLKFYSTYKPDIVITDIRMPIMNGLEMSRQIKEQNPDAQIIVTTAYSDTDYLIASIDIGINQFVLKPINKDKLINALLRCVNIVKLKKTITQKEAELRHSQRLEAIGQLAGGIAHDFNNILTSIVGYANLLKIKLKAEDPLHSYVDGILTASEKATNLTQSLLAFSRKQIIDPKAVELNDIVRKISKIIDRIIGEDIAIQYHLAETEMVVFVDQSQIEQVIINLCTNARDAMLKTGGTLTISTKSVDITKEKLSFAISPPQNKGFALLSVSDTGTGMPEEIKRNIFEPFFTTKGVGKGTGLGLSIVYGIIKQHNGYIDVDSTVGVGSTFRVYLPLVSVSPAKHEPQPQQTTSLVGTETVLVAEDDDAVMSIIKEVLQDRGYKIITAVDGEDAVKKFQNHKDSIDLLLFDVIMPKKNGKQAYEEIKKLKPDIKIIFMSGYTADIINEKSTLDHSLDFVPKPVTPDTLLHKIREVLDR